uniref:ATP-binding cassette transporter subfamily G-like protein 2 n=1 Tax=Brachionus rotundiformis TaxID=96890 RepID=A0A7H9SKZ9_9BILA|nr:ATP-binding cassette transporter subfamily G-like protein 2 [Brachionus rotundiformis]
MNSNNFLEIPRTESESVNSSLNQSVSNQNQIALSWKNVTVSLPKKNRLLQKLKKQTYKIEEPKKLVSNVDGYASLGEVMAIMGASGAGKTTLLNVLNFRNRGKLKITGQIALNGRAVRSIEEIREVSSYVQQDDLFIGYLTVREHLLFQAMLRMDKDSTKKERMARVNKILQDLNLKKCENTVIGFFGRRGISGGEKRRLAFASEIITNPSILFCDEPTSGLDSFMAMSVMEAMRNLASQGKCIICTIHQPSSEIFQEFDKLCLLAEGRLAYHGSLPGAAEFFQSQGLILPPNFNPADFYIRQLAILPTNREECLVKVNKICDNFAKSSQKDEIRSSIESSLNEKTLNDTNDSNRGNVCTRFMCKNYKTNFFIQLSWLLWRNSLGILREPFTFKIQVFQTIIVSLLFGLIYLRLQYDQKGVMDMNGFMFLCICNNGFATMFFVVNVFPLELPIFIREYQNGMYKVISYYLAKTLTDLPTFFVLPILFMSIAYWMANLNNSADRFFICVSIIVLVVQCSLAFGCFLSAIAPSTNVALALAGPILVPLMIFSGFLLNNESIPKYFIWLRYLSWFSYSNEAILLNQWKGVKNITCAEQNRGFCFTEGEQIINYYNIDEVNIR